MTRIISGAAGATRLEVPKSGTRPTSDRVREAMFSTLDSWNMLDATSVLDLFAGSGALGLEAASRGATQVTFVEKHPPAAQVIERNARRVRDRLQDACELSIHRISATTFLETQPESDLWDVVFIDPPYEHRDETLGDALTQILPRLKPGAVVMLERGTRSGPPHLPVGYRHIRHKKYGETTLWWVEAEGDESF